MKPPFFARYGLPILMLVVFLSPFMLMGTRRSLRSNKNDIKSWLPPAYEETHEYEWYCQRFQTDLFVLASWEGCTLDSTKLELLARKLVPPENEPPSETEFQFFRSAVTGSRLIRELMDREGLSREEAIKRLRGFLIGKDGVTTCLVLTVRPEAEAEWEAWPAKYKPSDPKFTHALVERVYSVAENECAIPREELHLGGPPVDAASIDIEGERTLMRLLWVCAAVGVFMSWWCLRSWPLAAMVFATALASAGSSLFLTWATGTDMNAILLTMPMLVFVAATSGAIHLANYYRDTVRQNAAAGMRDPTYGAPDRAIKSAWLPLSLATGTTAIGLGSLAISELVPIKLFGIYSAAGVVLSFVLLCFFTPALFEFWPLPRIAEPVKLLAFDPGNSPKWRYVGEFIIRRNKLVLAGCVLLMGLGLWGMFQIATSISIRRLFSTSAKIIRDYTWLENKFGPVIPMEVVLRVDKKKCSLDLMDQMILVRALQKEIESLEEVGNTLAAPTFARPIPRHPNFLERRVWIAKLQRHQQDLRDVFLNEDDEYLWRITSRVPVSTDLDYGAYVASIRSKVEPVLQQYKDQGVEGLSARYTGLVPLIYKAQRSMLDGLILGFIGDLALVGVAMVFLMRDWSSGLLLMFASVFPILVVFGAMGWMGILVDVGTVMVPAVALGVTVDDAIHFMIWCRHGQQRGMNRAQAIMFAYEDCARAIYQSWGVIGLGLSAFALSSFTPTQRFGAMMVTMLTASSFGNLVLLPALLASPAGHFFWRGGERVAAKHRKAQDAAELTPAAVPVARETAASRPPGKNGEPSPQPVRHDRPHVLAGQKLGADRP